jgi:virulence factor Mce-like protein
MNATGRRHGFNPLVAGFLAGVLIAAVVGLMADINLQFGAPWSAGHALTAQVSSTDAMAVGSDVRIAGRLVGQVTSIKAEDGYADVTFHVDGDDWPLPSNTTATVRLATLLGQKYIQLNPGSSSSMLPDNGTIGLQSTQPVVDFDQILDTFNTPTRDALTQLIRTTSAAVQNQEGTLQQLIPDLSDLSVNSRVPTQELVNRNPELNNILINLGITAQQLDQSRADLAGVIDNLNSVSATLASNEGSALKGYISNTDTLNQTTNQVLDGGSAKRLDTGLQQLSTFTNYLDTLLVNTIPQSEGFSRPISDPEPSDLVNGNDGIPSKASIDLIYEIGSATSQGDALGNFFLRQSVAGVDPCGLVPSNCGLPAGSSTSSTPQQPGGGLLPSPLPSLPIPIPIPVPTPPPLPCIPVPLVQTCPSPTAGTNSPPPLPTLPPLPTPTLPPLDDSQSVPAISVVQDGWFTERMR